MTIAYCDTSVLADLLLSPEASLPTREYLNSWQARAALVSSRLAVVELGRMSMRAGQHSAPGSLDVGSLPLDYLNLSEAVVRKAAALPVRHLKALDAIHVASVLLTQADIVLTRDRQMQRACEELGIPTA